jgi:hypothetical protein
MSRFILLALLTATLAACSEAGPYGYGYAVNERPSLKQLSITDQDSDNPFRPGLHTVSAFADLD